MSEIESKESDFRAIVVVHVYREAWAEDLYGRLATYLDAFQSLERKILKS